MHIFVMISDTSEEPPTPHYNTAILQDLTIHSNNQCLHTALRDSSPVKEGINMLKVWLRQRELDVVSCQGQYTCDVLKITERDFSQIKEGEWTPEEGFFLHTNSSKAICKVLAL